MPKIIHYRSKCIGCNICCEIQPRKWRMSKKDGKATLMNSQEKREVFISNIHESSLYQSRQVAQACPVKIIKVI